MQAVMALYISIKMAGNGGSIQVFTEQKATG